MSLLWVTAATRWVEHDDLPDEAKKAVHVYMQDGGFNNERDMEAHKHRLQYHLEHVPTDDLKERMRPMYEGELGHTNWDDYHRWYTSPQQTAKDVDRQGQPRYRPYKERWPVIADDHFGHVIDDGWHRFHSYVAQGDKTIPVLHMRSKE